MPDRFRDRVDVGRQLAVRLAKYAAERPVVVALPRGGVAVAAEIARALDAPLDVLVARKLGARYAPEFGIGAIAPGGVLIVDRDALSCACMSQDDLEHVARRERAELARRERRYRGDRPLLDVGGHTVILVDDGIATGVTVRAAIAALRSLGASRVILAAGVSSRAAATMLTPLVDEMVALRVPDHFFAVGLHYEDFRQVIDDEVVALLAAANRPLMATGS